MPTPAFADTAAAAAAPSASVINTLTTIGGIVIGLLAVLGIGGLLVRYLVSGLWAQLGDAHIDKRIEVWAASDTNTEKQKKMMLDVIDNQVRRDDGLIHTEIKQKTDASMAHVLTEIQALRRDFETERKEKAAHDQRLSKMEGNLEMLVDAIVKRPG